MNLKHLFSAAALAACAAQSLAQTAQAAQAAQTTQPTQPAQTQGADGKVLFAKNCAACHQASGKGIPGAFPALAGSAFVQGAPAEVATVLLKGRGGMPDFSNSLDDGEIAQVLTYVRTSWGNGAPAVAEQDVSAQRAALGVAPATHGRFANKH